MFYMTFHVAGFFWDVIKDALIKKLDVLTESVTLNSSSV